MKKEIPAKPNGLIKYNFLIFSLLIPPKAISSIDDNFLRLKYLNIPNWLFLFFLKIGDKKILLTPWCSLILISFKLCADPIISKFFLLRNDLIINSLFPEEIYKPSALILCANLMLFLT